MNQQQPEFGNDGACGGREGSVRRPVLFRMAMVALLFLMIGGPDPASAQSRMVEDRYNLISAFLYNFLLFTEWPGSEKGPMTIGVLGDNPFGPAAEAIAQKNVSGRQVKVVFFQTPEEIKAVHVLFIPRDQDHHARAVCHQLRGKPVLTVGESDRFTREGGIIRFFEQRGTTASETVLRVEINETVAETAGLRFRSRLMRLAQLVQHPWPETL